MRLVFDIETNNFLEHLTTIHCIVARNLDDVSDVYSFGPHEIDQAVELLQSASTLVGHNSTCFDIPAIKKLYPSFNTDNIETLDTLVLGRMIRSDLRNEDFNAGYTAEQLPKKLHGSHSLEAWGRRLGVLKGDFGSTSDWSEWSQEMQDYCEQDTLVTHKLWYALAPEKWSKEAITFEHEIAEICHRIGRAGWSFDNDKAAALYGHLSHERTKIEQELQTLFPAWEIEEMFIPKVNNSKRGYVKGEPFMKVHEVQFNPNSRKHIEYCLRKKYDWKPKVFTPSGDAKIDESVLEQLPYPEAKKLARSFMLQKRIGQLAEGKNAWMKLVDDDGKLRHTINPLGTVTGRASSFGPNLQQVVSVNAPYGKECRELFTVRDGYELVGSDLSGIELRCLAHFLQDGGKYADVILNGDIHTQNMHDMGLTQRSAAKVAIYCLIYGGGDGALGNAINGTPQDGRKLRDTFFEANPAFANLIKQLKRTVESRGHLYGLDKRKLHVRGHAHANVLLQSAAALISKKWVQLIDQEIKAQGLDATIMAWVHDEVQIETKKGDAEIVGNITRRMAQEAGRHFGFTIPIDAEYNHGRTWADTH